MRPEEQAAIIEKINQLLDAELPKDDFVPALEGHRIVEKLREEDPGLLFDFLDIMAEHVIVDVIGDRRRSLRAAYLRGEKQRNFSAAVNSGDPNRMDPYRNLSFIVDGGVEKKLGKLTADDLRFVSDRYTVRGNRELTLAAFHTQLALKVENAGPDKVLQDVVPRAEYDQLVQSLGVKVVPPAP